MCFSNEIVMSVMPAFCPVSKLNAFESLPVMVGTCSRSWRDIRKNLMRVLEIFIKRCVFN